MTAAPGSDSVKLRATTTPKSVIVESPSLFLQNPAASSTSQIPSFADAGLHHPLAVVDLPFALCIQPIAHV